MLYKFPPAVLLFVFIIVTSCDDHQGNLTDRNEFTAPEPRSVSGGQSPSEIFDEVNVMFSEVGELSANEIEELNRRELRELSMPLLMLWENTIRLNQNALSGILEPLQKMAKLSQNGQLTNKIHKVLSSEIRLVLSSNRHFHRRDMEQELGRVKEILLSWNRDQDRADVCRQLFNSSGGNIILMPGDNLSAANHYCPEGSFFYLTHGNYPQQTVKTPKPGNHWIGTAIDSAILDGQESTTSAFSGQMNDIVYSHFEIRNYTEFGIHFIDDKGNRNVKISNMTFRNIAGDLNGQEYGAILTEWMTNLLITDSHFENVTSAIRLVNSRGPIRAVNNSALNPGRNFFQCDKCSGRGIRINNNSIEHREQFGADLLEDHINIFQSEGEADDWIQVNNNRARGNAKSRSGSFLILGDSGGKYQEAVGNRGVNPGQVGIGIAGGEHIKIENNMMYGETWEGSRMAFYSIAFTEPCDHHLFPGSNSSSPNRANWLDDEGRRDPSWTDGKCGIEHPALRDSILDDATFGPEIWDEWE